MERALGNNNGFYMSVLGQIMRSVELETIANNVSNQNTEGFIEDQLVFTYSKEKNTSKDPNQQNYFVKIHSVYRDFSKREIISTGNPFDIAIEGQGFFKVMTQTGAKYTISGRLLINQENILVNSLGYPYLNADDGIIEIPEGNNNHFEVAQNGVIVVENEEIGQIAVYNFDNQESLIKEGDNLFSATTEPVLAEEYKILQGAFTKSNVNSLKSMVNMVNAQRKIGIVNSVISDIAQMDHNLISKLSNK